MWKEFKAFIMTGNVIDFAVAVILAGAVGAVANGFVQDVMMPFIGYICDGPDFSQYKMVLSNAQTGPDGAITKAEVSIMYGKWITTIVNLLFIGFVLLLIVKVKNKIDPPPPAPPAGPTDNELLTQIRDALKK